MRNNNYGLLGFLVLATTGCLSAHHGKCVHDSCFDCSIFINNPDIKIKRTTPPTCTCKEGCSCKKMKCSFCMESKCACVADVCHCTVAETKGVNPSITPEIIVLSNATHVFELPANPSTGYHWVIAEQNLPKGTTVILGNIKHQEPVMPGASGTLPIEIKRGEVGEGTLRLQYVSPSKKVHETREYIIKIVSEE